MFSFLWTKDSSQSTSLALMALASATAVFQAPRQTCKASLCRELYSCVWRPASCLPSLLSEEMNRGGFTHAYTCVHTYIYMYLCTYMCTVMHVCTHAHSLGKEPSNIPGGTRVKQSKAGAFTLQAIAR